MHTFCNGGIDIKFKAALKNLFLVTVFLIPCRDHILITTLSAESYFFAIFTKKIAPY